MSDAIQMLRKDSDNNIVHAICIEPMLSDKDESTCIIETPIIYRNNGEFEIMLKDSSPKRASCRVKIRLSEMLVWIYWSLSDNYSKSKIYSTFSNFIFAMSGRKMPYFKKMTITLNSKTYKLCKKLLRDRFRFTILNNMEDDFYYVELTPLKERI